MVQVDSANVIRLILQFLQENNLNASLETLIKETGVHLNAVNDSYSLKVMILEGKWEELLRETAKLALEPSTLTDVFEQIVCELCKGGQTDAARTLIQQAPPLLCIKATERYYKLEELCITDPKAIPDHILTRQILAENFNIPQVEKSRLLSLIGQAMKFQGIDGDYDPFLDILSKPVVVSAPRCVSGTPIDISKFGNVKLLAYAHDMDAILLGLEDGFLTLIDPTTITALPVELVMDSCIATIHVKNKQALVSAVSGELMLWNLETGEAKRRFSTLPAFPLFAGLGSDYAYSVLAKEVRILSLNSGFLLQTIQMDSVAAAASLSGDTLAVGCKDGTLSIIKDQTLYKKFAWSDDRLATPISAVLISDNGFVYASSGTHLEKFCITTGECLSEYTLNSHVVHLLGGDSYIYVATDSIGIIFDADLRYLNHIPITDVPEHWILTKDSLLVLHNNTLTPFF